MNFNERLNGYDTDSPKALALSDSVDAMADRATAAVLLLQLQFSEKDNTRSSDEIIANALEGVYLELKDIKNVVADFHESQKKPQ